MPELPEVQTVVNHIRPKIIGKQLMTIIPIWGKTLHNFNKDDIHGIKNNNKIIDVYRRAKFIIIEFTDKIIAIHLRMTGKLYISKNSTYPKHATTVLEFDDNESLIFEDVRKFGRIYLYDDLKVINSKHGPEPLDKNFTVELFKDMIKSKNRNIKALLLDQSFLSGLGNIYVDESLWESGIHPNSISSSIPVKKISTLHNKIQSILRNAILKKGTTIIDFSVNGESGKYANDLSIYGKNNKACFRCNSMIIKLKVAGRGTYACTKCQKKYDKKSTRVKC